MDSVQVTSATTNHVVSAPVPVVEVPIEKSLSLDQLVRLGKVEDEVEIASFKFKLTTLSSVENAEVMALTSNIKEDEVKFSTLRLELLGRAIVSVNDVALESLYVGTETVKIKRKLEILKALQQTVINSLWEAYDKIINKSVELTKLEGTALKN